MKKLLCVLLVLCLFLPAAFAAADDISVAPEQAAEQSAKLPDAFPSIYFGEIPGTVFETFQRGWGSQYKFSKQPVEESVTLSTGEQIMVMTLPEEPATDEYGIPLTAKFYFLNGRLIAAVQIVQIPENAEVGQATRFISDMMTDSKQDLLDLEKVGIFAELLGETAHLENGLHTWQYTVNLGEKTTEALLTVSNDEGNVYITEFPAQKDGELDEVAGLSLKELKGYGELDGEKKTAVRLYAQFLVKQQKEMLEQYIEFLKTAK
jgi:hypothetical protein